MGRLICSIGVVAVLLLQSAVALAATPPPSPALSGILLKPPGTGYKEQAKSAPGVFEGAFDAVKYAAITASPDAALTKQALDRDGFLSGFGRTWALPGNARVYREAVMVFTGAKGATTWLRQSEAADKSEPTYSKALNISGINAYYGARLLDKVHKRYSDIFVFVKGNDAYLVAYTSTKDVLATVAATQAKRQYNAAPPYTIPPSQWPESKVSSSSFDPLKIAGAFIVGVLILGLIAGAVFFIRSRRRPALQEIPPNQRVVTFAPQAAMATPVDFVAPVDFAAPAAAASPFATAASAAVTIPIETGALQMSEDGRSWWDGSTWRDAEHEVPPAAQRSDDGAYWWDGTAWRPMPPSPFGT